MTHAADRRGARALVALVCALALTSSAAPAVEALGDLVSVVVIGRDSGAAADATVANHGRVDRWLPIVDGVSARVPSSRLDDLARTAMVVPDYAVRMQGASYGDGLASVYPHEVGATDLWARGTAGDGVTVALVDTGVADVPDLAGRVVATANFTRERDDEDTYGHGTFQAGLIAGSGASSDGAHVGVAPEADLLSVKVADHTGSTSLGQVLAGVQLVDHSAERFGVRVMLLAIDSESPLPPDLDPLSWALRTVWSHGVVVVVPAGNDGPDGETIASPGEDPWLLTAGSVDDLGTADVEDDPVSDFSSRGPTRWGDPKPELAAPGEHLVSLRAPGSTIDVENPSAVVGDAYFKGSGTSMSAAVTAGAVALLLAERPELTPDEAKAVLMATAQGLPAGDADSVGAGVVDAAAAASFDDDLPELPDAPDLGDRDAPFSAPGLDFGWEQDDRGIWRWRARQWKARQWTNGPWGDEEWEARQWKAYQWAARQWHADTWEARQWLLDQWEARQWHAWDWAARQWHARRWNARQWRDEEWMARQWVARQWNARQWSDEEWAARQWVARQWNARQWNARQWNARQWNARQWNARQWNARQWSARQWSARQWNDADWTARQWSARQWSARQWNGVKWD